MKPPRSPLSPALIARLAKREDQHKYDHGHALVLAGGPGRGGAARLAARAALRVGAGLVTLGCPDDAMFENAVQLTSVMLRPVQDAKALQALLDDPRINAMCLGPGLGLDQRTRDLVRAALEGDRALVLDADALSAFSDKPADLFSMLHSHCVLTPHMGEFARLFPEEAAELRRVGKRDMLVRQALHRAAERAGCVVLLKGATTRIVDPTGQVIEHHATGPRSAPWLATAGTGDVLAGLVAGLLARGFSPQESAHAGAFLHVEAARFVGPGLIAEDLPDALPAVFRALGL